MISTFMTLRVDRVDSIPLSTLASAVNSLSIGETFLVSFILQYRYGFLIFIHTYCVSGSWLMVRGYWFLRFLCHWKLPRLPEGPLYTTITYLAVERGFRSRTNHRVTARSDHSLNSLTILSHNARLLSSLLFC